MLSVSRLVLISLALAGTAHAQLSSNSGRSTGSFGSPGSVGAPGAAPIGTGPLSNRSSVGSSLGFTTLGATATTPGSSVPLLTAPGTNPTASTAFGTPTFTTGGPLSSSTMSIIPLGLSGSVNGGTTGTQ
jgi:hypothetical protein